MEAAGKLRDFQIIAHRGASAAFPENTMAAFEGAIAAGADMIELDLTLCASGEFVVIHDDTLDRTTNGSGLVCDWTWNDLRSLDAGSWYSTEFSGERIASVEQVLGSIAPRVPVNLEVKPHFQIDQVESFKASLRNLVLSIEKNGLYGRVVISSFNYYVLRWLRRIDGNVRLAFLYSQARMMLDPVWACKEIGAESCNMNYMKISEDLLERLHGNGIKCFVYVVNDDRKKREFMKMRGLNGFFTDKIA
ncbi:MAG: glycerophosphodiester phosphodiesterase family protein [Pseudoxanthomonas sp.]